MQCKPRSAPVPRFISRTVGVLPLGMVDFLMLGLARNVCERHAELIDRLGPHRKATIFIDPTDLPIGFRICPTQPDTLATVTRPCRDWHARIAAPLAALLAMIHGELDGDALFFARTILIEGDTEAVLALRNALDNSEIDLSVEIAALCGPLRPLVAFGMRLGLPLAESMTGFALMRHAVS